MAWSRTQPSPEPCSPTPRLTAATLNTAALGAATLAPRPRLADGAAGTAQPLPGGTANRGLVVRVGATVVRPGAPCRRATHALLDRLAAVGFDGAPRVLAAGPATETLTYIE